mmetsp:Transcript_15393/g.26975  ORF Transcript_15393/g.26975 Transcript_15393/m.26975 type:complete len:89 (+) Transcript_15393:4053-4319(+)
MMLLKVDLCLNDEIDDKHECKHGAFDPQDEIFQEWRHSCEDVHDLPCWFALDDFAFLPENEQVKQCSEDDGMTDHDGPIDPSPRDVHG